MLRNVFRVVIGVVTVLSVFVAASRVVRAGPNDVFLPLILKAPNNITGETYAQGVARQWDLDNPVRPANNHADKNLALRGYVVATTGNGSIFTPSLIRYGQDDNRGPQLPYLFNSPHVPSFPNFYRVRGWNWQNSPNPGTQGPLLDTCPPGSAGHCLNWPISGIGLGVTPGERIYAPRTGTYPNFDIGGGYQMMVIYADTNNITLRFGNEDTANPVGIGGYTLHIRGLTVDANLLALYNSLDNSARNTFMFRGSQHYNLPYVRAGQAIGFANGSEIIAVIVDTGTFMDPRSCDEWWIGFTNSGTCPQRDGVIIR